MVKPYRTSLRQKTIKRIFKLVREQKLNEQWFYVEELESFTSTINSYLGMLRNTNGYKLRKEICLQCINLFVNCDEDFTKLKVVLHSHIKQRKSSSSLILLIKMRLISTGVFSIGNKNNL